MAPGGHPVGFGTGTPAAVWSVADAGTTDPAPIYPRRVTRARKKLSDRNVLLGKPYLIIR
jgi:hypothetical protein